MDVLSSVVQDYLKTDIPAFNVGDTVKVHVKIKEGNRERIQIFEGFVLKRQNGGIAETFTVRRIASGQICFSSRMEISFFGLSAGSTRNPLPGSCPSAI